MINDSLSESVWYWLSYREHTKSRKDKWSRAQKTKCKRNMALDTCKYVIISICKSLGIGKASKFFSSFTYKLWYFSLKWDLVEFTLDFGRKSSKGGELCLRSLKWNRAKEKIMLHIQGSFSEVGKMSPIILSLMFWTDSTLLGMGQVRRGGGEIGRHS